MTGRITNKDKEEFRDYLRQCSDQQVLEVWEKERKAKRRVYTRLALEEMSRRRLYANG